MCWIKDVLKRIKIVFVFLFISCWNNNFLYNYYIIRTNLDLLEKIQQKYTLKWNPNPETCLHIGRNSICIGKKYALELGVAATHPMQPALACLLISNIQKNTHPSLRGVRIPANNTVSQTMTKRTNPVKTIHLRSVCKPRPLVSHPEKAPPPSLEFEYFFYSAEK